MAELTLSYDGGVAAGILAANMDKAARRVRATMKAIAQQAADEIQEKGVADIQQAGRYGDDWTSGLKVKVGQYSGGDITITTSHSKPYYSFLNVGGTIKGNPLLWLPTEENPAFGTGLSPKDYPGRLIAVNSKRGVPLLIDPSVPKGGDAVMYTGVPSVTIPQKFHILAIIREVARSLKSKYKITYATSA